MTEPTATSDGPVEAGPVPNEPPGTASSGLAPAVPGAGPADAVDQRRSADLALARLHLRLGSLALARAELETLAGRDALDEDGLLDLAEVRWRTGDLVGAGEAAAVILGDDEDGPLLALVIAAEATLGRGRPTEGRRLANRALELADGTIDEVFAGMPRGAAWPADATVTVGPSPTLFDALSTGTPAARAARLQAAPHEPPPAGVDMGEPSETPDVRTEPATLALWGDAVTGPAAGAPDVGPGLPFDAEVEAGEPDLPSGDVALDTGRDALAAGRLDEAAAQLALALRLDPAVAPAVVDVIDGRRDRELAFVRGDAYRLLGREGEARRAFADAVRPATTTPTPTDDPPEGDPA